MKILKSWILKWLNDSHENHSIIEKDAIQPLRVKEPHFEHRQDKTVNFKLLFATGGKIIQTQRYDSVRQDYDSNLYIITEDQNLGEELEKIITVEVLRH
jgi:hypothetical protein